MLRWIAAVFCSIAVCNCTTVSPQPRTAGAFGDGSAKWGLKIAQPLITAFAADANLYEVFGADVGLDGRLPANTGDWSFVSWSPSKHMSFQVTVEFDGSTSTTTKNEPSPPSFNGQPVPPGWVDSVDALATVAPYLGCATRTQVAVLNVASYAEAPNQSAWAMHFDAGQNQLVKWDGTYIGPQGAPNVPCATNLGSSFLKTDSCANIVFHGTPYNMKDPNWLTTTHDQNRDTCAYKFFSGFHMLGYQTEMASNYGLNDQHLRALHKFQADQVLPTGDLVTIDVLRKLDAALKQRETLFAIGQSFPLYQHMQPLHPHQISRDALATIYHLPMSVLPASLQIATLYEYVQCINSQCVGSIVDANDNPWPTWPIDLAKDYRFVGAYFEPNETAPRLPSAVVDMETVLHEYAHYLDGGWGSGPSTPDPQRPRAGAIDTAGFNDISYDKSTNVNGCVARRTNDPKDWISRYGFLSDYSCPAGTFVTWEEWAEAFQMYVTSAKQFRAAAAQNATIAQKYNWLKTNVFAGREYDTDWPQALPSGCNDVPGAQAQQPGWMQCNDNYVWDGQLRIK